ncbi:MAG TPA: HAD domain-containing protein [Gammaproteobacteria bacterium]|nr:HAD domain-containing protein [Gammaproteobacteria bacterium]
MIVFIDFDGVLHTVRGEQFEHMDIFCAAMRAHPAAKIVISSSWREVFDLADLRALFADDIAEQIIGRTPVLPGVRWPREREIRQFLHDTGRTHEAWIAIDDITDFFRDHTRVLYCDPERGLTSAVCAALDVWLSAPWPASPEPEDAAWLAEDLYRLSEQEVLALIDKLELSLHPARHELKEWAAVRFSRPNEATSNIEGLRQRFMTEVINE